MVTLALLYYSIVPTTTVPLQSCLYSQGLLKLMVFVLDCVLTKVEKTLRSGGT